LGTSCLASSKCLRGSLSFAADLRRCSRACWLTATDIWTASIVARCWRLSSTSCALSSSVVRSRRSSALSLIAANVAPNGLSFSTTAHGFVRLRKRRTQVCSHAPQKRRRSVSPLESFAAHGADGPRNRTLGIRSPRVPASRRAAPRQSPPRQRQRSRQAGRTTTARTSTADVIERRRLSARP
jgi:hypothetical protein